MPIGYLTEDEAAAAMEMSPRKLAALVKAGTLIPRVPRPGEPDRHTYWQADIEALKEILNTDHETWDKRKLIYEMRRATFESRALRSELNRIKLVLGLDIPTIGTSREELLALREKAVEALALLIMEDATELLEWARILQALNEAHLDALRHYTGDEESWRVFLDLGVKLCREEPRQVTRDNLELHSVYCLLNASLRRVRMTAYFYVRHFKGQLYAEHLFPERRRGDPHEDVINLAYNNAEIAW